jgi:multimeric flavodoxin WrbA
MIDRMRVFTYGNLYAGRLKNKVGGALVVAFFRHGGLETTLSLLNQTFTLFQMIGVGCGGLAVTSTHGTGKIISGLRHMVLEDVYGISSASQMIQRAVEIARIMEAGKKALHISG